MSSILPSKTAHPILSAIKCYAGMSQFISWFMQASASAVAASRMKDLPKKGLYPRQNGWEKPIGGKNLRNGGASILFCGSSILQLFSPIPFLRAPITFSGTPISFSEIGKSLRFAPIGFLRTPISFCGAPIFPLFAPISFSQCAFYCPPTCTDPI